MSRGTEASGRHAGGVLVIGYGNPARGDDGLGPALAAAVEKARPSGVDVDSDYQLTVEDAADAAQHDVVVFADADQAGDGPFFFRAIEAKGQLGFSSHGCEPPAVMALARDLFDAQTKGYLLGIRGYEFDPFDETMTGRARANLAAATEFLLDVLASRSFDEAAGRFAAPQAPASR